MTGPNRSTAVMQRRVEPHDSLDYFPTPPWATRALCEFLKTEWNLKDQNVWEPACGEGHMARPLAEYFREVLATDVHDYSASFPEQHEVADFLIDWGLVDAELSIDWVITNPPFRLADEFIRMALSHARIGCAMLVRTSFLEGHDRLFSDIPPAAILQFAERVGMFKGIIRQAGSKYVCPHTGQDKVASTATSYCWIIWLNSPVDFTRFSWIAPCRQRLETDTDYPVVKAAAGPMPLFEEGSLKNA